MLEAKHPYDKEFAQCQGSFQVVPWRSTSMSAATKTCPSCRSHLVHLTEDAPTEPTDLETRCRQCGAEIEAGRLFEASLNDHFETPISSGRDNCSLMNALISARSITHAFARPAQVPSQQAVRANDRQ